MDLTLVVLAAGVGTRFGGLKQLAPVGPSGEALLEYATFDALRAGFSRVVLVVREETEAAFRQKLGGGMAEALPLSYVHQLPGETAAAVERLKPWGTGHAVLSLAGEVNEPFAVVNADDFYGAESYRAIAEFLRAGSPQRLAVVGFDAEETVPDSGPVSRARLDVDGEGLLHQITELHEVWRGSGGLLYRGGGGEEQALASGTLVSMNMWGFTAEVLPALESRFERFLEHHARYPTAEFLLPEVVQELVAEGRFQVEVLPAASRWCGVTFRRDTAAAQATLTELVAAGSYPSPLWA